MIASYTFCSVTDFALVKLEIENLRLILPLIMLEQSKF